MYKLEKNCFSPVSLPRSSSACPQPSPSPSHAPPHSPSPLWSQPAARRPPWRRRGTGRRCPRHSPHPSPGYALPVPLPPLPVPISPLWSQPAARRPPWRRRGTGRRCPRHSPRPSPGAPLPSGRLQRTRTCWSAHITVSVTATESPIYASILRL